MERSVVSDFPNRLHAYIDVRLDCGDVSDVTKNGGVFGEESECTSD
jgi:hypothetical protein